MIQEKMAAPLDFIAYVQSRGYKATPITNHIAAMQDGAELTIMGYELHGPRRGRAFIEKRNGLLSVDRAALYCDGWDYATRKVTERKSRRTK